MPECKNSLHSKTELFLRQVITFYNPNLILHNCNCSGAKMHLVSMKMNRLIPKFRWKKQVDPKQDDSLNHKTNSEVKQVKTNYLDDHEVLHEIPHSNILPSFCVYLFIRSVHLCVSFFVNYILLVCMSMFICFVFTFLLFSQSF